MSCFSSWVDLQPRLGEANPVGEVSKFRFTDFRDRLLLFVGWKKKLKKQIPKNQMLVYTPEN